MPFNNLPRPFRNLDRAKLVQWLVIYIALMSSATGAVTGIAAVGEAETVENNQLALEENQNALIEGLTLGCFDSREPLVRYFRGEIISVRQEIQDTRSTDPSLFPDIPPARFRELLQRSIDNDKERIGRLQHLIEVFDPLKCARQYQPTE